jgi:hypothetical protein
MIHKELPCFGFTLDILGDVRLCDVAKEVIWLQNEYSKIGPHF